MISESKATMKKQVLIVGAGPVGLTMAVGAGSLTASRCGSSTGLRSAPDKSKAIVLWRAHAGTAPAIAPAAPATSWRRVTQGRRRKHHRRAARPWPMSASTGVDTPVSVRADGAAIRYGKAAGRAARTASGLTVERQNGSGAVQGGQSEWSSGGAAEGRTGCEETVEADWLDRAVTVRIVPRATVSACSFLGDTIQKRLRIGGPSRFGGYPLPSSDEMDVLSGIADGVLLVIFPMSRQSLPGHRRSRAKSKGSVPAQPTLDQVQAILTNAARGHGGVPILSGSLDFGSTNARSAIIAQGRVFVAGDAAHVHSPAGG